MRTDSRVGDMRTDTRLAGRVIRYHTWPCHQRQSIAEHSWQVLRIIMTIWKHWAIPTPVIEHVTFHDVGEIAVGDPPYPIKRDNPELKEIMDKLEDAALAEQGIKLQTLMPEWTWRVKVAHTIEMMEFALDEAALGSYSAAPIVIQMRDWLHQQKRSRPPGVTESEVHLIEQYVHARMKRQYDLTHLGEEAKGWVNSVGTSTYKSNVVEATGPGTPEDGGQHARYTPTAGEVAGLG